MNEEAEIIKEIVAGNEQSVLKLQHWCQLNGKEYVASRIAEAIEDYSDQPKPLYYTEELAQMRQKDLRDYVVRFIYSACPNCGCMETVIHNHSLAWHDGDIVCEKCGTYVRMFDAG